jgi:aspartokinase-like uncharacterized kinase
VTATVVIKVGGSLLDWPEFPRALDAWLEPERAGRPVLIIGGGALVDVVRTLDSVHAIGENRAHALALRTLDVTAHAVAGLVPGLRVVPTPVDLWPVWEAGLVPVLAPKDFMDGVDRLATDPLPESWSTTSDSIAARVARHLGACRLVLLKSAAPAVPIDRAEAVRRGFVDPVFPQASKDLGSVALVNLRAATPTAVALFRTDPGPPCTGQEATMTRILAVPLDQPGVAPRALSPRLRSQLNYFMSPAGSPGIPPLGEHEYWFAASEVARWVNEGVFFLVSPLDTANQTEVELSEEQEEFLNWLSRSGIQHVRVDG